MWESGGGPLIHTVFRCAHGLCEFIRRALVQVCVVDGDRDLMRISGGCRRVCERTSTLEHQHGLRGLSHSFLLVGLLPWGHKESFPLLSVERRELFYNWNECVSRIEDACDGRENGSTSCNKFPCGHISVFAANKLNRRGMVKIGMPDPNFTKI